MPPIDYDTVRDIKTEIINVAPGATNAVLVTPLDFENSVLIKPFSGGSALIVGVSAGITLAAGDMASLFAGNQFYMLGTAEALSLNGPCRFYMMAIGATAQFNLIRSLNN